MGMSARARRGEIGHLLLNRGRHHERGAILGHAASVLRHDLDAEAFELRAELAALAAIEGAVAAARVSAGHRLELGERAHA